MDVKVNTSMVTVQTVPLTKPILRQLPILDYSHLRNATFNFRFAGGVIEPAYEGMVAVFLTDESGNPGIFFYGNSSSEFKAEMDKLPRVVIPVK